MKQNLTERLFCKLDAEYLCKGESVVLATEEPAPCSQVDWSNSYSVPDYFRM